MTIKNSLVLDRFLEKIDEKPIKTRLQEGNAGGIARSLLPGYAHQREIVEGIEQHEQSDQYLVVQSYLDTVSRTQNLSLGRKIIAVSMKYSGKKLKKVLGLLGQAARRSEDPEKVRILVDLVDNHDRGFNDLCTILKETTGSLLLDRRVTQTRISRYEPGHGRVEYHF